MDQVHQFSFPNNRVPGVPSTTEFRVVCRARISPAPLSPAQESEVLQWAVQTARQWLRGEA